MERAQSRLLCGPGHLPFVYPKDRDETLMSAERMRATVSFGMCGSTWVPLRFQIGDPAVPAALSLVHYRTDVVSKNNMHQYMGVIVAMGSLPSGLVTCHLALVHLVRAPERKLIIATRAEVRGHMSSAPKRRLTEIPRTFLGPERCQDIA